MPEGQWEFLKSKGPRTKVTLRISSDARAALEIAGTEMDVSATGFATLLVESWAEEWLAQQERING